jgi:hypothetical protein
MTVFAMRPIARNHTNDLIANRERISLWPNSLVMIGLFTAHVIIQHRLVFLGVAPVGTDPCDGVNAYAFIAIAFIAMGSILRMLWGRRSLPSMQYLHDIRSLQAVLYAIFITFAAEIVSLARNAATWDKIASASRLFAIISCLTTLTVAMQLLIFFTQRTRLSQSHLQRTRMILPVVFALVALAFCPEWPTYSPSITAHILTVAVGAFVVFVPMRVLLSQIVLRKPHDHYKKSGTGHLQSTMLLLSGVAVALFAFFRHIPFAVIDVAELFIAYGILGKPLGFDRWREGPIQTADTEG